MHRLGMVCAVVFASIAVGLLTACGHSARHGASSTANRLTFGYDASRPLGYVDRGVVARRSGITVHDIAYTSGGERVDGYLVEGSAPRRRPGIVLVHGSGGDRRQLLGHAFALALHHRRQPPEDAAPQRRHD